MLVEAESTSTQCRIPKALVKSTKKSSFLDIFGRTDVGARERKLRVEQVARQPCEFCTLISRLGELSRFDRLVYQEHLIREHNLKEYYIER